MENLLRGRPFRQSNYRRVQWFISTLHTQKEEIRLQITIKSTELFSHRWSPVMLVNVISVLYARVQKYNKTLNIQGPEKHLGEFSV